MKAIVGGSILAFLLLAAAPAAAQRTDVAAEVEAAVQRSGVIPALERLAAVTAPEMERLATSLEGLARRMVDDPALRRSAVQVAQGAMVVAEIVVVEHAAIVREALRDASARLEEMAARMR